MRPKWGKETEDEFEYDWGTIRSGGRVEAIAADYIFFEPGNCMRLSNRSEEVGIALPRGRSDLNASDLHQHQPEIQNDWEARDHGLPDSLHLP